jgi:hypothetical protein
VREVALRDRSLVFGAADRNRGAVAQIKSA